ncbi:hypothetical protein [Polaribacter sp. IC073]|uniref:hypothetical protein n=1 Tax=Polaribacter sp. IC073 TaxID=2508540 RepID=UPI0011BEDF25|nr:hypothetical protein [Polaribacter sp. IC073]TXD45897.1 hypothetical protein ES045_15850 [Polaribacter sp. IC073]
MKIKQEISRVLTEFNFDRMSFDEASKQLFDLYVVVKCNCDESKQLEEEFEIHHLINDTYQVIGKDSNTVWKQGTLEDCNEWVML